MSGSESIMSIFVLSPALGTPLTLPTAAHHHHCSQPATVNTRSWELITTVRKGKYHTMIMVMFAVLCAVTQSMLS